MPAPFGREEEEMKIYRNLMRRFLLSLLFVILTSTSAISECPKGDLSRDGIIDLIDLHLFASEYLDFPGGPANLDGLNGVDLADFSFLTQNWKTHCPTLLINEFMAVNDTFIQDEYGGHDDWIEIYNYGEVPVDIGGMWLTDDLSDPNNWQVPSNDPATTTVAPHSYLLIWADREMSQGALHADFKLSSAGGEDIGLLGSDLTVIDSFSNFALQSSDNSFGRFPNGSDTWQSFINGSSTPPTPFGVNGLQPDDMNVMISEIMYHPYHRLYAPYYEAEDPNIEYIELYNSGSTGIDLEGWQFSNGIDYTFPASTSIAAGSYLVVAANLTAFNAQYPAVTNVVGSWSGRLSNSGERVELINGNGVRIDYLRYADEGDWAVREQGPLDNNHYGWVWSDEHDSGGKSLELINPSLANDLGVNWSASNVSGGSPGSSNSVLSSNIAPIISDLTHAPVIPDSTETVTVRAQITDELTTGINAILHYRQDVDYTQPPNSFSGIPMFDDGLHNDLIADDGIYAAQIPAHPNEVIIEYYVQATDSSANSRTYPAPVLPSNQQLANALYQVNDQFDLAAQQLPGTRPLYHIIMTDSERHELLVEIGNGGADFESDAQMNATFISFNDIDIQTRYNVGVRIRGSSSRTAAPMSFRVNFTHDKKWNGVAAININSRVPYAQVLGSVLCQAAGLEAADAMLVETRVNAIIPPGPNAPWLGTYAHVEVIDNDFAEDHFPFDDKGNIYKCMHKGEYADLRYEGPDPIEYRNTYFKNTNANQDDWSDLINLIDLMNNYPDISYVADISPVININQWMTWFETQSIIGNIERGLANGAGDDYCMYRGTIDTHFVLLPYDLDSLLATGGDGILDWTSPGITNESIWKATKVDAIDRFLKHPDLEGQYYAAFGNLINTTFSPAQVDPLIDATLTGFAPQWLIDDIKQYFVDRNTYVLSVIP